MPGANRLPGRDAETAYTIGDAIAATSGMEYNMALLKALVIGMGVLIVAAMALLAYGLISKTSGPDTAQGPSSVAGFGDIAIPGSETCSIESVLTDQSLLIVELGGGGNCERVVVIDMATGTVAGTVTTAR